MLKWRRAYGILLIGLIVVNLIGSVLTGLYVVTRPFQLDYGEGIVVYQASRITDPAFAYGPIDRFPFVVYHYPPMFHWISRAVAGLSGDLLMSGRLVSWISGMLVCALIGWLVATTLPRRIEKGVRIVLALFAAALPLGYYNFYWTWLARTDALAIALAFAAVTLMLRLRGSALQDTLIAGLLAASLLSKQTSIAAPAACLLSAAVLDRARAVRLFVALLGLGGAAMAGLAWFTDGRVLRHLFLYNTNPFSAPYAALEISRNLSRMQILAILACSAAVYAAYRWRARGWSKAIQYLQASPRRRNTFVMVLYSFFAALVTVAVGKEGSNVNYFLEWNFTLAPLAVLGIVRWLPKSRVSIMNLAVLILMPFVLVIAIADGWAPRLVNLLKTSPGSTRILNSMVDVLKQAPGPVLSEDMLLLHLAGKEVPAEPAIIQSLAASGIWNEEPFLDMIRQQKFSLIVVGDINNRQRWTPSVVRAIEGSYTMNKAIGEHRLYAPSATAQFR